MDYLRRIVNILIIPIVLLMFSGMDAVVANAVTPVNNTPNGFTVSPVITEVTVNKGQSDVIDINVANPSTGVLIADPVVNDFVASTDESGTPNLIIKPGTPLPLNNFISLVQPLSPVTLQPGAQATLHVTISVPLSAASGGYYGAIRFVPGNTGKTANVGLDASVGSLVIVTVPGNLIEKMSVVQMSAAKNGVLGSIFFSGKISVVTRIKDDGNIQSAPFGRILLKNSSGKIVTSFELNQQSPRGLVLPGSIRRFTNNLNYTHLFGHYTIVANIGYGTGGNLLTATASFWYIPVWAIIVGIVIIIVIVALVYWLIAKSKAREN